MCCVMWFGVLVCIVLVLVVYSLGGWLGFSLLGVVFFCQAEDGRREGTGSQTGDVPNSETPDS